MRRRRSTAAAPQTALQAQLIAVPQSATTSDDYYTPAWIFEAMNLEFDLDVCSPPGGLDWIPARRYYTLEDDGLAQRWHGRVWMNPPYSHPAPWVDRFLQHRHGVALLPFSKSKWFIDIWGAADAIVVADSDFPFVGGGIYMPGLFRGDGPRLCRRDQKSWG